MVHCNNNDLKFVFAPLYLTYVAMHHFSKLRSCEVAKFHTAFIFHYLKEFTMLTIEQITSAQKNNLNVFFGLTETAFSGVEKLVELNLAAAKAAFNENVHHVQSMISIKDPAEVVALQSSFYQPIAEKSVAYSRHVYEIASSTSSELSKSLESQTQETQHAFMSMIEGATKNAPQGTEAAVAMFKNAMTASQNAIETAQKAMKQVTETAEANLQAAVSSATTATKATKKRAAT